MKSKLLQISMLIVCAMGMSTLTGCIIDQPGDEEIEPVQQRQGLDLLNGTGGQCVYSGTVTCSHPDHGTQTSSTPVTRTVAAGADGGCNATYDVSYSHNGWSCNGILPVEDPLEEEEDNGGDGPTLGG